MNSGMLDSPREVTIDKVYPWGRSFEEYRNMFSLTDADLNRRIISCADGPASFNAEMHRRGRTIVSCDPLYRFSVEEIRQRIGVTYDHLVALTQRESHRFVWGDRIQSPQVLGRVRREAMETFLSDFEIGKEQGRYLTQSLPRLEMSDRAFDLALCSHFLFLYSNEFSLEFHIASVLEMCRVAREVRIFPLLNMQGWHSVHVEPVMEELQRQGLDVTIETVPYEFQCGGNRMMRICRHP